MFSLQKLPAICTAFGQRAVAQIGDSLEKGVIRPLKRPAVKVPDGLRIGREIEKGGSLYTTRALKEGDTIFAFQGRIKRIEDATPLGLQVGENLFLQAEWDDPNRFDDYTNHSCNPNGVVRFRAGHPYLVAARDTESGEELTFNYNTTEWDMFEQEAVMKAPSVFSSYCRTKHCIGRIMGFRYLSIEQKLILRPNLSPYLLDKLEDELVRLHSIAFSSISF